MEPKRTSRYPVTPRRRRPNRQLTELRINAGLSPQDLGNRVGCSAKCIRDAERGTIPHPRLQFAIAEQFELLPLDIWPVEVQRVVA